MTEITSIDRLFTAAKGRKWTYIDTELVPELGRVDGNIVATRLLERVDDKNPDIRDAVATAFSGLIIPDRRIFNGVVNSMIKMATTDPEKSPAGRAVMFLWKRRGDKELRKKIQKGINNFISRKEIEKWKNDLMIDVEGIDELFRFKLVG
jgi:hypothetical protein